MTDSTDNARGPERIWATGDGVNGSWTSREIPKSWGAAAQEYIRADLAPTPLADPRVAALVEAAQWARNRLETIADESWYGDARDFKRSLIGVFADFDEALASCGSQLPAALSPTGGNDE